MINRMETREEILKLIQEAENVSANRYRYAKEL